MKRRVLALMFQVSPEISPWLPWLASIFGLALGCFYNACIRRYLARLTTPAPCLVPLLSGLLAFLLMYRYGFAWPGAVYYFFGSAMLVASFIDLELFILPDFITLGGAALAPLASIFLLGLPWQASLAGAAVGGGGLWVVSMLFRKLRGTDGIGLGDVKLMLLIGGLCGVSAVPIVIGLACCSALIVSWLLFQRTRGPARHTMAMEIPFGPFLSFGTVMHMLFGQP